MTEPAKTSRQVAYDLAKFLTTASGYGRDSKTPLDEILQAQITAMTEQIAAEVIEATPELASEIRQLVQVTIRMALSRDSWLSRTVVNAVASALTDLALEREQDDDR